MRPRVGEWWWLRSLSDAGSAWAKQLAVFAMLLMLLAIEFGRGATGDMSGAGDVSFKLVDKWAVSPDSKVLRFSLPGPRLTLAAPDLVPSGVYALLQTEGEELKKSYSPISTPDTRGHFDLLVKAYPPRAGGGLGSHLCGLRPGDSMRMGVKPAREMHGSTAVAGRWANLGFVAGGTGVAPFVQIIRYLLQHPTDTTQLSLLSINRHETDILLREELDSLAHTHADRFRVTYSLTQPSPAWGGAVGRGDVELAKAALPAPTPTECDGSTMVMLCGTDGFVDMWAGGIQREVDPVTGNKKKVQGEVKGLLRDVGFRTCEVYKF